MIALALRFWKPLAVLASIAILILGFFGWLRAHDAAVLSGYVALAEKTAADSRAAEIQRQADAYAASVADLEKQAAADAMADAARAKSYQSEVDDYEQKLKAAQRDCYLDDDDRDFILRHQ